MRFRPLTRPLHAPRRARVLAALSLLTLIAAIVFVGAGMISLPGALLAMGIAVGIALIGVILAVYGLNYIWTFSGRGTADCALALIWALPVITTAAAFTYVITQTPTYPDLATNANDPPQFEVLGQRPEGTDPLPLDAASPAERIRLQLAYPDLETAYIERPGWHIAEVLEAYFRSTGVELLRLDTEDGLTFEAEFSVPGEFLLVEHDIAMRLRDDGDGTSIDVRGLSNIPLHDFGTNGPVLQDVLDRLLLAIDATQPPTSDL